MPEIADPLDPASFDPGPLDPAPPVAVPVESAAADVEAELLDDEPDPAGEHPAATNRAVTATAPIVSCCALRFREPLPNRNTTAPPQADVPLRLAIDLSSPQEVCY